MGYSMNTEMSWARTNKDLRRTFAAWKISEWDVARASERSIHCPVTVWFKLRGRTIELTLGTQRTAEDNLRAVYLTIEAMRLADVRGLTEFTAAAYAQLEAPKQKRDPSDVLGVLNTAPDGVVNAAFRELSKTAHPDKGGSAERFKELEEARDAMLAHA